MARGHTGSSDLVTVAADVVIERPFSWGVRVDDADPNADLIWLPKSLCEHDEAAGEFEMPEWLATEKGLT